MNAPVLRRAVIAAWCAAAAVACGCGGGSKRSEAPSSGENGTTDTPANVTATAADGAVTVRWDNVPQALAYDLYWSNSAGVTKTNGNRITGVASPYVHAPLTNGKTYHYVVTAVTAAGEGPESVEVSATPQAGLAPAAPLGVTATAGNAQVTLRWNGVADATGYAVYWGTSGTPTKTTGTKVAGVTSPWVHSPLTNGVTYRYVVTAIGAGGESAESGEAVATPQAGGPAAPTGLTATGGCGGVTLAWDAVAGATAYNAYYAEGAGVTPQNGTALQAVQVQGTTRLTYVHAPLPASTTYHYVVTAVLGGVEGPPSAERSAATDAVPDPAGTVWAELGYSAQGAAQAELHWNAVPGATSYNVYWTYAASIAPRGGTKLPAVSPGVVLPLEYDRDFSWCATAVTACGESPGASCVVGGRTPGATLPAPVNFQVQCTPHLGPTWTFGLSWYPILTANGYAVSAGSAAGWTADTSIDVVWNAACSKQLDFGVRALGCAESAAQGCPVAGATAWSGAVTFCLEAPTGLSWDHMSSTLRWNQAAGAEAYLVLTCDPSLDCSQPTTGWAIVPTGSVTCAGGLCSTVVGSQMYAKWWKVKVAPTNCTGWGPTSDTLGLDW